MVRFWWSHFKILADIDMKKARTNTGEHPGYRIKNEHFYTRALQLEVLGKMMEDYNRKFTTVIGLSQNKDKDKIREIVNYIRTWWQFL